MAGKLNYKAKLVAPPKGYVEGLEDVIKRFNDIYKTKIKGGSSRGLVQISHHIRRATELKEPFTPVDKGNLRASYFTAAAEGLVDDPIGKSGQFKQPRKHHITLAEIRAQHSAVTAESLAEVRASKEPSVIFGYSANYALWVHEMVGIPKENWSRPGSDAKWLEAHLNNSFKTMLKIVQDNAKVD